MEYIAGPIGLVFRTAPTSGIPTGQSTNNIVVGMLVLAIGDLLGTIERLNAISSQHAPRIATGTIIRKDVNVTLETRHHQVSSI